MESKTNNELYYHNIIFSVNSSIIVGIIEPNRRIRIASVKNVHTMAAAIFCYYIIVIIIICFKPSFVVIFRMYKHFSWIYETCIIIIERYCVFP